MLLHVLCADFNFISLFAVACTWKLLPIVIAFIGWLQYRKLIFLSIFYAVA